MNSAVRSVAVVTRRELWGYFSSALAYVFLIVFLLLVGITTFVLGSFFERAEASLNATFFAWLPWMYLILVPAIGMRLWSIEFQQGTAELLFTYPVDIWHVVLGKFLAAWLVLLLANILTFPLLITVCYLGNPDLGAIACAYLGSVLLAATYLSLSSLCSAMTSNSVVAFAVAALLCLFLIICSDPSVTKALVRMSPESTWLLESFSSLGVSEKYDEFQKGNPSLSGLVYFLSLTLYFLYVSVVVLQASRGKKS